MRAMFLEFGVGHAAQWNGPDRYVRVDRRTLPSVDVVCDLEEGLPFRDGIAAGVFSSHCFEHLSFAGAETCVRETFRVLRPGSGICFYLPDFGWCARAYLFGEEDKREGLSEHVRDSVMGQQRHPWDFHRSIWDAKTLSGLLERCGFVGVSVGQGRQPDELEARAQKPELVPFSCEDVDA